MKTIHEILYIIPNQYSEDECKKINSKLKDTAEKENLKIINEKFLGKKKMSYSVKNIYHGYYFTINFSTELEEEKNGLKKLSRAMKLMPEILRHQIIKYEENTKHSRIPRENTSIRNAEKIIEPVSACPSPLSSTESELNQVGQKSANQIDKIKVADVMEEVKTTKTHTVEHKDEIKKKIDLNDLDKKLDEFIENVDR
ncbi:30S ribosomal protein S6 [Patescibacteria group bacterium]